LVYQSINDRNVQLTFPTLRKEKIESCRLHRGRYNLSENCVKKEKTAVSQAKITDSLLTSTAFYSLFQTLPPEARQGFLQLLFQNNSSELEDFIFYLACKNSRKEGFLSESEFQSLLESLPQ